MNRSLRKVSAMVSLAASLALAGPWLAAQAPTEPAARPAGPAAPDPAILERLKEVQARHEEELLARPEVVAMGIGRAESGRLGLLVLVDRDLPRPPLPERLEGFEVVVRPSGRFRPGHGAPGCVQPCHADQQTLPVEMGNSARNTASCSSCTLGFKACDPATGRFVYVTNAHCNTLADQTPAQVGTVTRHVARGDAPGCDFREIIGTIGGFAHPCDAGNDTVDASKVFSDYSLTTSAVRDIGWPLATPGTAIVGLVVRKSGRTTGLTTGVVSGVNMRIDVPDGAYFCDGVNMQGQIYVTPLAAVWSSFGDSGAGVFNEFGEPVGLHWATEDDGVTGIASPIDEVLSALGLTLNLFGCTEDCAFTRAAEGLSRGAELLELAHRLRDDVLARSPRGRRYAELYERHSPEVVRRLAVERGLLERTRRLLVRHRRDLAAVVDGGIARVGDRNLRELDALLADLAAGASPPLREALESLRKDVRDPEVQADFGVEVVP